MMRNGLVDEKKSIDLEGWQDFFKGHLQSLTEINEIYQDDTIFVRITEKILVGSFQWCSMQFYW